jgi:dUTP pyrophosphatase
MNSKRRSCDALDEAISALKSVLPCLGDEMSVFDDDAEDRYMVRYPQIKWQPMSASARCPTRATRDSVGWDLYVDLGAGKTHIEVAPRSRATFGTGIALGLPPGWVAFALPRSGLAAVNGVTLANAPGLIDPDYRGEVLVTLQNQNDSPWSVRHGDRVAQLVFLPAPKVELVKVDRLEPTYRGSSGYGSSGR